MSTVSSTVLQALLEENRALYTGHVFGHYFHPIENIIDIAQQHERFSWLFELCHESLLILYRVRQYYIIGQMYNAYRMSKQFMNQCELVSQEILDILDEFLPHATVSYQRDLCDQYQAIMEMSIVEVSLYLYEIQHGEDFAVCLRKLALETLDHPRVFDIHNALAQLDSFHQEFLDSKSDRELAIKKKINLQQRVETAKGDLLAGLREIGL